MKEDKLREAINEIINKNNKNIRPLQDASDQDLKNAVVQELKLAMKEEIGRAIGINRGQEEERNRIMNLLRGILIAEGIILLIIVFPWFYLLFKKED
jgi:predicted house-cleaning noncanonical NTP pyrophosphatase (MazG superfamily)